MKNNNTEDKKQTRQQEKQAKTQARQQEKHAKKQAKQRDKEMRKQYKGRRLYSQILGTIIALVAGTILLCWILNSSLLELVYINHKRDAIKETYETLYEAANTGELYEKEYRDTFEQMYTYDNLSILVSTSDGSIVMSSAGENASANMLSNLFDTILRLRSSSSQRTLLEETSRYSIERQTDTRMNGDYIVLWGSLGDGNIVLIRSAVETLRDSADVSNQFLLLVGLATIVVSIFVSMALTARITKPVTELTDISRRMTELDFDARYEPRQHQNEIDELGLRMNTLADSLEKTIRDLKQANTDLRHDIEIRDQSEQMRKEFLSNVSHELKTPIALIQGYAEGLEDGISDNPEDLKFYCDVIIDESKRMNKMVQQLLALNQLEFGQNNVSMERFDVVEVVRGLLSRAQIMIEQNGIQVEFDVQGPVYVWADEFLAEQAIQNYITNAIHYAKNEKIIRIRFSDAVNNGLRISVFNTGDPIPEESLPHLWEKFYKVDKARTREYGGSGIGLSVVRAVMESFNRSYGVTNFDDGVEFWLELDM